MRPFGRVSSRAPLPEVHLASIAEQLDLLIQSEQELLEKTKTHSPRISERFLMVTGAWVQLMEAADMGSEIIDS